MQVRTSFRQNTVSLPTLLPLERTACTFGTPPEVLVYVNREMLMMQQLLSSTASELVKFQMKRMTGKRDNFFQ